MTIKFNNQLIIIALCVIITVLSLEFFIVWNSNKELIEINNKQNRRLSSLNATISELNHRLITAQVIIEKQDHSRVIDNIIKRGYAKLFFSNITPPISKLDAIRIVLSNGKWTIEELSNYSITATLAWVVFSQDNPSNVFVSIEEVSHPVDDYSPKQHGDQIFRYVWSIIVPFNQFESSEYFVDAFTGEAFNPSFDYPK